MIFAIDTETYTYNEDTKKWYPVLDCRKFVLGCIMDELGRKKIFTTAKSMFQEIDRIADICIKRNKKAYIYACNAEYDFYAINREKLIHPDIKYICFSPFLAIYRERVYFLDIMTFYKMSLYETGKMIGLPKGQMPENVDMIIQLTSYLERDTEIVMKSIKLLKEKLGEIGYKPRKMLTAGQLAMTSCFTFLQKNRFTDGILELQEPRRVKPRIIPCQHFDLVKKSFRGGRNEAFQTGSFIDTTLIDINSLYPYIMGNMNFPDLRTERAEVLSIAEFKKLPQSQIGVISCEVEIPNMLQLPYLPLRFQGYQIFPTNIRVKGCWTVLEIQRAVSLGYEIIYIEKVVLWDKLLTNPLKDYMESLYNLRARNDKIMSHAIKVIMNNLYGKFAQCRKNKDYISVNRSDILQYVQMGYIPVCNSGVDTILTKESGDYISPYVNPIISSLVTANARDMLYFDLIKIKTEDLLYCDTDSILFKGNYIDKFTIGNKMGQYKLVDRGSAEIIGEKRYRVNETIKISGIPRKLITKEVLKKEKSIQIDKIRGLRSISSLMDIDKIGSFSHHEEIINPHSKNNLIVPYYVDELSEVQNE